MSDVQMLNVFFWDGVFLFPFVSASVCVSLSVCVCVSVRVCVWSFDILPVVTWHVKGVFWRHCAGALFFSLSLSLPPSLLHVVLWSPVLSEGCSFCFETWLMVTGCLGCICSLHFSFTLSQWWNPPLNASARYCNRYVSPPAVWRR